VAYLPNVKKIDKVPANKQKGKKQCTCCHEEKKLTDFYISKSPLFSIDERVPVCKNCIISCSLNEDNTINEVELNKTLRKIDKPYYKDLIESAINQFKKEHSYVNEEEVKYYGKELLQLYFKLIAMRQDIDKSYDDSEKDNFIHQNNNRKQQEKKEISNKYLDVSSVSQENKASDEKNVVWSEKDIQNMNYVISMIGHNPFEDVGLSESDKKYCFNILSGYCDTEGITDDGNKMQGVIEITIMYCQCKKITETMNIELSKKDPDDAKIGKLTTAKSSLLSSISTIAKDNNIASNYNKNSKQGQSSLTSKMKEMSENNFEAIKVNLFDIKTSEAFKQIADLSNQSIMDQLTLDNNDYVEIIKEQREIIQKFELELDVLKEENRNLKNKIIDLENWKG
jgi:hypothetical protein